MKSLRLSPLEMQIMQALWTHGASSVREIQESFASTNRPAYTTIQTMLYRLERKGAVRRTKKISNAHIFDAVVSRQAAERRLVDDFLRVFGGRMQPVMAHFVESGRMTLDDLREAERTLRALSKKGRDK
jgi:BlaI family penicillinase repressor